MKITITTLLIFLMTSSMSIDDSAKQFKITIERSYILNEDCIQGFLFVNDGAAICYTLELPWLLNLNDMSCAPEGTYAAKIRQDGSKGWRIQLEDVPGREFIQIHIGNYTKQIRGCILIGLDARPDDCEVFKSGDAFENLQKEFDHHLLFGTTNMSPEIIVEIK